MRLWNYIRNLRQNPDTSEYPIPYVDPLRAGRHPFQTYMLALCFVAGVPYLFGRATAEAVQYALPTWIAFTWGLMLVFGSAIALAGSYWRGQYDTALTMERAGLGVVGGAALVYSMCIVAARDPLAPLFLTMLVGGFYLVRVPIHHQRRADVLSIIGLILMPSALFWFLFSPAMSILVGAFVILGFGLSCIRRARDIGKIFKRALSTESARVMTEYEGGSHE